MAPSYGSLIKEAIVLIDKFNGSTQNLDDFIEDVSKDLQVKYVIPAQFDLFVLLLIYFFFQDMDASHKNFILGVVSGCIEHKKLLDPVINVFYSQNGKHISRRNCSHFVSELQSFNF